MLQATDLDEINTITDNMVQFLGRIEDPIRRRSLAMQLADVHFDILNELVEGEKAGPEDRDRSANEVIEAADEVAAMPQRDETPVGPKAVDLTPGQLQECLKRMSDTGVSIAANVPDRAKRSIIVALYATWHTVLCDELFTLADPAELFKTRAERVTEALVSQVEHMRLHVENGGVCPNDTDHADEWPELLEGLH